MKIKFTANELTRLMEFAKDHYLEIPKQCKLPCGARDLKEHEKLALAYFQASLDILGTMNCKTEDVEFDLKAPDSNIETEN